MTEKRKMINLKFPTKKEFLFEKLKAKAEAEDRTIQNMLLRILEEKLN